MERPYGLYTLEESEVPLFTLPDPLLKEDGTFVTDAFTWVNYQRRKILSLFKEHEYGQILPRPDSVSYELLTCREDALEGTAVRKEIRIHFAMNNGKKHHCDMLLYIPSNAVKPVPAFLGLCFKGNHSTSNEADVALTGFKGPGVLVEPDARGVAMDRWQFRETIARGYASATICYHDIYPDFTESLPYSVLGMLFDEADWPSVPDKYTPIGAWAWGLSRGLDCLETEPLIDASRVAVHGHSRLGKTSLWAGATDTRFRLVISNDSGCGGGALHKRKFGENFSQHFQSHINKGVPCWFVSSAEKYIWHEEDMPMDQHELIALMAPRPVAIGTATQDLPADPKSEFLACIAAAPVYKLFGVDGFTGTEMPAPDTRIDGEISFHYRTGIHDQTLEDWQHYWDLADKYLKG